MNHAKLDESGKTPQELLAEMKLSLQDLDAEWDRLDSTGQIETQDVLRAQMTATGLRIAELQAEIAQATASNACNTQGTLSL